MVSRPDWGSAPTLMVPGDWTRTSELSDRPPMGQKPHTSGEVIQDFLRSHHRIHTHFLSRLCTGTQSGRIRLCPQKSHGK